MLGRRPATGPSEPVIAGGGAVMPMLALTQLSIYLTLKGSFSAGWLAGKPDYRLYRSQILQVSLRWKALAEIYKMHSFAPFSWDPFSNLNLFTLKIAEMFAIFY